MKGYFSRGRWLHSGICELIKDSSHKIRICVCTVIWSSTVTEWKTGIEQWPLTMAQGTAREENVEEFLLIHYYCVAHSFARCVEKGRFQHIKILQFCCCCWIICVSVCCLGSIWRFSHVSHINGFPSSPRFFLCLAHHNVFCRLFLFERLSCWSLSNNVWYAAGIIVGA